MLRGVFVVCNHIVHVHMEVYVKIWQRGGDSLYCENTTRRRRVRRNRSFHYEGPQVPQVTYKKGREGNAFISKCLPSMRSPMHAKRCLSS